MDLFECPKKEIWGKRQDFIFKELRDAEVGLGYSVSDHATALFMDMQIAYCSGAWLSVVVMSISVIDSHLRETEAADSKIGTFSLLNEYFEGEDINFLRHLRNKYVHHNIYNPILELNDWYDNREEMEKNATKAMKMTISALFQNPGI